MTEQLKHGDVREDGWIFRRMRDNGKPYFISPETWFKDKVSTTVSASKRRATAAGIPFDLTYDYIVSIFPKDWRCPVLDIPLEFGGERTNSPSLDRIIPHLGYVEGNVMWMSFLANLMKSYATPDQLLKFADYIHETYSE